MTDGNVPVFRSPDAVRVGDTILFSVDLLRQIADDDIQVVLKVREIHTQDDGTKILRLMRILS